MLQRLLSFAGSSPDKIAFSCPRGALTYAQLARRVAGAAEQLSDLPETVGLLAGDGIDWVIADLAVAVSGRTLVPVPEFFSREQVRHILTDAGVTCLLADSQNRETADALGMEQHPIPVSETTRFATAAAATGRRIIYTSGSTGTPKGVRLGMRQLLASVDALAAATQASRHDRHMSVLPQSLLLEQVSGIYLVIQAGARCDIVSGVSRDCARGEPDRLIDACIDLEPTTTVLVPEMLAVWVAGCAARDLTMPKSLRLAAVGGAAVPGSVIDKAWSAGIPAVIGYGLSECASVVSLTRPGCRSYAAGQALPGIGISLDAGEIVVSGPTLMDGYLGGGDIGGRWKTGDLGIFDDDGNLVVLGRKDNVIVLANGRNVSPEWIEHDVERNPAVRRCVVLKQPDGSLAAVVTPTQAVPQGLAEQFADGLIAGLAERLPVYARPQCCILTTEERIAGAGLLTAQSKPRRQAFASHFGAASR